MSNMLENVNVHPTGSPVIGTPISSSAASSAQPLDSPPKLGSSVPPVPLQQLDGSKMSKGRSEIETWVDYLEVFLPWIALFDDRVPSEVQKYLTRDTAILNNSLPKGESIRSTRLFLYLRQSFSNYPRGLDILKQIEREQLGVSAGYEAMRRLHQDLSVCSRIEASTLREEV